MARFMWALPRVLIVGLIVIILWTILVQGLFDGPGVVDVGRGIVSRIETVFTEPGKIKEALGGKKRKLEYADPAKPGDVEFVPAYVVDRNGKALQDPRKNDTLMTPVVVPPGTLVGIGFMPPKGTAKCIVLDENTINFIRNPAVPCDRPYWLKPGESGMWTVQFYANQGTDPLWSGTVQVIVEEGAPSPSPRAGGQPTASPTATPAPVAAFVCRNGYIPQFGNLPWPVGGVTQGWYIPADTQCGIPEGFTIVTKGQLLENDSKLFPNKANDEGISITTTHLTWASSPSSYRVVKGKLAPQGCEALIRYEMDIRRCIDP